MRADECNFRGGTRRISSGTYEPCAVNPLLRVSRYTTGGSFAAHRDSAYATSDEYAGFMTLLLYLNDGFCGGETRLCDPEHDVVPRTGDALVFHHHMLHEGMPVRDGTKYVLRSEVMYRKAS